MPFPTGSGNILELEEISRELSKRFLASFQINADKSRRIHGNANWFYQQPENKDLVLFYEYYHGDSAMGMGASHQTGWSSLIAALINQNFPVS